MKKILYVITKSNWGGAQRYVYDLAVAAKKEGHEVSVAYGAPGRMAEKLKAANVRTIEIPSLGRDVRVLKDISVFFELVRIFTQERPDIVHLNSSKIGALGSLAARMAGVPRIVFTAHGWAFNEDRSALAKLVIKGIYWLTTALSTRVIAVSDAMRAQVRSFPGVQGKMSVIHNGVEPSDMLPRTQALELFSNKNRAFTHTLSTNPVIVGTVGELHPIKGQRYLIEAAAQLRDKNFVLLIIGEGEERAALEELISENNLEEKVFLLGQLADAAQYMHGFDIFVLPSLSEGLAYAILEAGAAELPVVASRVGGIPEIIENGTEGVLVPPKNAAALASALSELMENSAKRHELAAKLREKISKEFSLEKMVRETFARYRS